MTRNTHAAWASLLVLVVVLSVAAAGAGPATAAAPSVTDAVEYDGTIELALDGNTGSAVQASNVDVWVDGQARSVSVAADGTNGRVVLTGLDDVGTHRSVTVRVQQSGTLDTGEIPVTVTGAVLSAGDDGNLFPGTNVAYRASDTNVDVSITEEGTFIVERSTGPNSRIYVLDTDGQSIGPTYYVNESTGISTSYRLRDLGLAVTADSTSVSSGDPVRVSVTSRGAARPVALRLVDVNSGDVVVDRDEELDGNGELSANFEDVAEGTYRVEVEDIETGITDETAHISVGATGDATVAFADQVVADQRGDVVELQLAYSGTAAGGSADVTLGGSEVNFEVQATVADADGDGQVTLLWNTADAAGPAGGLAVEGGSVEGSVDVVEAVDSPVTTGEYPVAVEYGGQQTGIATAIVEERSTAGVSVMTAPASVSGFDAAATVREIATPTDEVALDTWTLDHDWALVRLQASGLEGYVEDAGDVDGANGLTLTVQQDESSLGPNEDPLTVTVSDATLVADGPGDTYFLAFRPAVLVADAEVGDVFRVSFAVGDANPVTDGTEAVSTTFTFVNGTAAFDAAGDELSVPAAPGATVDGTATFAPGTELRVTLRREGGDSPFVEHADAVVGADGTWEATFDLSERPEGQTFTAIVEKDGQERTSMQGTVGAADGEPTASGDTPPADATDTPDGSGTDTAPPGGDSPTATGTGGEGTTPTRTSTPAPGFGPAVALVALLAVALVGRRR